MRISKKESIEYLKENYSKKTRLELTTHLDLSWNYIQKLCCLNNIKRDFVEGKNFGKYSKLMDLENLETCYWIGFLLADGHIYKESSIQVNLSIKDKNHILNFQKYIGDFQIYEDETKLRIRLSDIKTSKFLTENFNWKSNKTKIAPTFPKLSKNQMFSLIIGFIDGDGNINQKGTIKVKCDGSWREILDNFYYQLTNEKKQFNIQGDGCSVFYISKLHTIFSIKEKAEELNLPIMSRKWSKIKRRILKHEKEIIVRKLVESGKDFKEILDETRFGESIIYRIIREYQRKF
jgi:hypothetical protein